MFLLRTSPWWLLRITAAPVVVTWISDVWAGNCPRIITRTYQAADSCGNTTTCTQTITVNDSIAPAITCPANVTVACVTDVPAPDIALVIASDNCGTCNCNLGERCIEWHKLSGGHHPYLHGRGQLW